MSKELKEDIIFFTKALLVLIAIFGTIFMLIYAAIFPTIKKEQNRNKEIQSYTYIIIDGIYFKTSEIKEFENKSGTYYITYLFVLEDGTKIKTDSYILTNKEEDF